MYFYFDQLFRDALNGIEATAVSAMMMQVAGAILLVALLFNVYEAFVRGGDVRTLGIGAVKYLILGLILLGYSQIFLGVNTMFNQVAEFISTTGPGGRDVFGQFAKDVGAEFGANQNFLQTAWGVVSGSIVGSLSLVMLFIAIIIYVVAYAIFCILYAFYGSVLYVCGPLVLALYPALSTTGLARTYLTNLVIFHAWGMIYAILGCLMSAIHLGTVQEVLRRHDAAGFFAGLGDALLLGLVSILLALCIAFIPMIARRIVQGDVGSTMFAVMSAAMTAATLGATAAMNGLGYAISHGRSGGGDGANQSRGGGVGKEAGSGKDSRSAADRSSQQPPKPPEDKGPESARTGNVNGGRAPEAVSSGETAHTNADAAVKESSSSTQSSSGNSYTAEGTRSQRGNPSPSHRPLPFSARVYTPMSLTAIAAAGAGTALGTAYRKTADALRSKNTSDEKTGSK